MQIIRLNDFKRRVDAESSCLIKMSRSESVPNITLSTFPSIPPGNKENCNFALKCEMSRPIVQ